MINVEMVRALWGVMDRRDWSKIPSYFSPDALIYWHNTEEIFTPKEFADVNANYPGIWRIHLERLEAVDNLIVTVVRVESGAQSWHATSFFEFKGDKIKTLHEYWGEDGQAPDWRKQK